MDDTRIVAWDHELRAAHSKLRAALELARDSVDEGADAASGPAADLTLFCVGFCSALDGHHRSEDAGLFPELRAEHPELGPVIDKLMQDHSMLSYLLADLRAAIDGGAEPADLHRHLDGIGAIMESHFAYEERQVLVPLAALRSTRPVTELLGPL
ncbi:hemerythrin domain-containing protein [Microbacterium sp. CFBP9034]|uniref:hemerythrin domain-containing protein n=1 Tax=Microbacterium sp. CFBP9034 TaxID=3096540 RepID=UPI002A6A098C|nr:hemerythrin domain-containing protein [Microbacterium sp. CFBP9034]MDY0908683.1 hemerythrin domain-containing protein [Microbacterium sp. CFBP9034]